MANPFIPLRVFTAYTMLEGAIDPKVLAKQAKKLGFPAAAICDRNGLYAAMAFCAAAKGEGVQPIVGTLLAVARPAECGGAEPGKPPVIDWLPLYAQDASGYDNLCALVSAAHLDRPIEEDAHVRLDALEGRTDGLIALTGAGEGALARLLAEGQEMHAALYAGRLETLFGDRLYIELARRGNAIEEAAEARLIDLAYARDLPLVATNPTCFTEASFHEAHDAMLCIADSAYVDSDDRRRSSPDTWLKPAAAMDALFEDLPEALLNTVVVAQRTAFAAPKRKPILPSLAGDREGEAAMLRQDAYNGLLARLRFADEAVASASDAEVEAKYPTYFERLAFETDIIVGMGFPGYFLIVADFIKWAKDHDIPVGPGRGSGAGSVVAWALTITDLDPLRLGLLFERFLNPERVSMPDFDIDFCETRRGEVIRYVQEKYGRDHVAQIITFGRLKARAVLKDTGRVLQMSYGQVDRLAKLVPNHPTDPWTLERSLNGVAELVNEYEREPEVKRLLDLAKQLEGFPRHSSTHAAGVVIGDRPLDQLVPLYRDPRSDMPVTQFDMKHVEDAGLVKFDFLGLKTLSVLQKAVQMLAKRGIEVDLAKLAWDDPAVFELLMSGNTVGVFQLESEGMRRTLSAVRPTCFEDIIALVSLYRPGPMDNIPMFGARKNGREPIEYPHALLEGILSETYGIFVYQEQVMQAAQVLAGYTLGGADMLRRAMGKKIKAEMDAQREIFVKGCAEVNAIPAQKANELFDLIDKFAGYGFNKSHAAAYALVAYQTAWMKAHHKPEFFAASMCFDMAQTDKLSIFVEDMRRMDVPGLPPSINHSEAEFSVEEGPEGPSVRYALGALKGVGEKAMEELCAERVRGGPFRSIEDFADRIDPRMLNQRQLESLAAGGAFECLGLERATVHGGAETVLAHAKAAHEGRTSGQGGLFGGDDIEVPPIRLPAGAHWSMIETMAQEKDAFGFYFSSHPTDRYRHLAQAHGARSFAEWCALPTPVAPPPDERGRRQPAPTVAMAVLVEDARWRTAAKSGRRYLFASCSDASGQFMASCFDDDVSARIEETAKAGGCGLLAVELDRREGDETPRVTIRGIRPFDGMSMATTRLRLDVVVDVPEAAEALAAILSDKCGGRGELHLSAKMPDGLRAHLLAGRGYNFDAELVARIEKLPGIGSARLGPIEAPRLALVG
ncbi:DNA polymerase III subunit alpha [Sphingomonas sp. CGMCC 1.13654]|uniref:DNA polymerase III subunit alpha n=1 Tax=Sphingomonas chungangi TaxID=2683589 RepID=A0A838LCB2_9SPHN|nr:DNA polymerase III subunit alpha [Sphingomonas chungangi]MBA2936365.1 DNA polymerase III subunit alpha [Sphingomonas chungangi]MVW55750.1 DNA polymerase III subunit alpha [Sphingomonas chungangi]